MKRLIAAALCCALAGAHAAPPNKAEVVGECAQPEYPKYSPVMDNIRITMKFLVAPDGTVRSGKVTGSSGVDDLNDRALAAFSKCRYKPALKNGKPVQAWQTMKFDWVVTEQPEPN